MPNPETSPEQLHSPETIVRGASHNRLVALLAIGATLVGGGAKLSQKTGIPLANLNPLAAEEAHAQAKKTTVFISERGNAKTYQVRLGNLGKLGTIPTPAYESTEVNFLNRGVFSPQAGIFESYFPYQEGVLTQVGQATVSATSGYGFPFKQKMVVQPFACDTSKTPTIVSFPGLQPGHTRSRVKYDLTYDENAIAVTSGALKRGLKNGFYNKKWLQERGLAPTGNKTYRDLLPGMAYKVQTKPTTFRGEDHIARYSNIKINNKDNHGGYTTLRPGKRLTMEADVDIDCTGVSALGLTEEDILNGTGRTLFTRLSGEFTVKKANIKPKKRWHKGIWEASNDPTDPMDGNATVMYNTTIDKSTAIFVRR